MIKVLAWYLWYVEGVGVHLFRGLGEHYPLFYLYQVLNNYIENL